MKLEAPFDVANTNATRLAGLLLLPLLALLQQAARDGGVIDTQQAAGCGVAGDAARRGVDDDRAVLHLAQHGLAEASALLDLLRQLEAVERGRELQAHGIEQ